MAEPEHEHRRRAYVLGTDCAGCIEVGREYGRRQERLYYWRKRTNRARALDEIGALNCPQCDGLLAEDDDARIFCLRCESELLDEAIAR